MTTRITWTRHKFFDKVKRFEEAVDADAVRIDREFKQNVRSLLKHEPRDERKGYDEHFTHLAKWWQALYVFKIKACLALNRTTPPDHWEDGQYSAFDRSFVYVGVIRLTMGGWCEHCTRHWSGEILVVGRGLFRGWWLSSIEDQSC